MAAPLQRSAHDFLPSKLTYGSLRRASAGCRGCDLYKDAIQTVFGEGPENARVMMIGEVPGDEEDKLGHPFVGPAGRLLDRALSDAGIERSLVYMTNAVKHFKWKPAGKRRLHQKPKASEISACKPWLMAEIEVIASPVIVCLGATAAQALLGSAFRVTKMRGKWIETAAAPRLLATIHPSSVLRAPDAAAREQQYREFVRDLTVVAREL